jgi:hypothetical protein
MIASRGLIAKTAQRLGDRFDGGAGDPNEAGWLS